MLVLWVGDSYLKKSKRKLNCKINSSSRFHCLEFHCFKSLCSKTNKDTNKNNFPKGYEIFTLSRKVSKWSKPKHKRRMHCRFQRKRAIFEDRFGTKAYPWSQQDDRKIHYKVRHGVLASGWTEGCSINTWFITTELEPGYSVLQKLGMVHIKRSFPWKYRASSPALQNH